MEFPRKLGWCPPCRMCRFLLFFSGEVDGCGNVYVHYFAAAFCGHVLSFFLSLSFSSRLINMSIISLRCAGMAVSSDPVYDAIHVTYYWSLESRGEQLKSPSRRFVFAHIYPSIHLIHPCLAALSPLVLRNQYLETSGCKGQIPGHRGSSTNNKPGL